MTNITQSEQVRLAKLFGFNSGMTANLTSVYEAEDWSRLPSESGGNCAHWILGHIVMVRHEILRKLTSDETKEEWEALFDMGAKPADPSSYPSPEDLLADMQKTSERLQAVLPELDETIRDADWGTTFPDGSKSVGEALFFFYFHETYHIGQLGLLRRVAGKQGFA